MIPLAKPDITEKEREAVLDVLRTPQLSLGPKLKEFEEKIAEYIGVRHALAVNSGTSALHLVIRALGIREGDEVITTPFSFISSSNCILYERAKPIFVDIDSETYNIDTKKIEEKITGNTKAIIAVDVFGRPADWNNLAKIAKKHNIKLIEDSAESFGSDFEGKKCGSFGDAAIFGFYPNKQITTGEGGAVVTDDREIFESCHSMRNQGRDNISNGQHDRLGYNYRLSELNCALGIAQLERIEEIIAKRKKVKDLYYEKLSNIRELILPSENKNDNPNLFVYTVRLADEFSRYDRDHIMMELNERGIQCGNYFTPIHLQPSYVKKFGFKKGDFPICENVSERIIALPFFNALSEGEISYIAQNLKEILKKKEKQ